MKCLIIIQSASFGRSELSSMYDYTRESIRSISSEYDLNRYLLYCLAARKQTTTAPIRLPITIMIMTPVERPFPSFFLSLKKGEHISEESSSSEIQRNFYTSYV